ncbi:MAG: DUF3263 domain-containing protein [Actinobacteria bacterium]|jgi:hypothetical protein|nr:DUF3263 domain-containing protein [Actinomycetota bacterium]NCW35152.1 DUF3263 domain-containing protein [Actinomycetota bacterium]NCZ73256.1 DUF3263 domain-containing protein [Actinomycetota bacterium]NDB31368.1 DUF3263 domain-containing protein [Actinomycetota bacterium]NDC51638.1 DUF3263 domain-containing protein [Actinomycetota bacterium]
MEELNVAPTATLSDLEVRILDFERHWWRYAGAKDAAIREQFDLSSPQYYELLNNLIDREDALNAAPLIVKRLRRIREARVLSRTN